ncbi:MAG TPA: hypothetical protein VKA15_23595 [Isosphaeraceae bacterium]|nr:hypothetical protein [Isosphaeraceae bacterium]
MSLSFEDLLLADAFAERRAEQSRKKLEPYYKDPVAFAHDLIAWPNEGGPTDYQDAILATLPERRKVCVRSCHGAAKTCTEAIAILWFSLTRDAAGVDWKVPTTAGAWRQLEKYLWPEVHKWARSLIWHKLGREPFNRSELQVHGLRLRHGRAFAVASDDPAYIEGAHADSIFYVFDESKSIQPSIFDAAEGAFSGGVGTEAFALATSTPGEPSGRFYDIQAGKPGFEDWYPMHVTLDQAIAAGRVSREWADQRARQWGRESSLYSNRVLGEFHGADEDGLIPLSWVELAVERWRANHDPTTTIDRLGVDVARSGSNQTCIAPRAGQRIVELRYSSHEDTMTTAGRVGGILSANPGAIAVVDTDGVGAGVTDRLREMGHETIAFHGGEKTRKQDKSGELSFLNTRAAAWWALREALDPAGEGAVELPDDPTLLGDLTTPHWDVDSNSRIRIEGKDDIQKRLGRSPDAGDAVVMAFWQPDKPRRRRRMVAAGRLGPAPEQAFSTRWI